MSQNHLPEVNGFVYYSKLNQKELILALLSAVFKRADFQMGLE